MTLGLFILLQERTFADALAIRFEREPDVHVVAALDATVLPSRVFVSSQVDVVLLDADLADNAAFYLCQELSQARDAPCVIFLSHSSDPECIVRAIRAGAAGWVRKDESLTRLIYVIRGVARGETWLPPDQTGEVLRLLMRGPDRDEDGGQLLMALTGREREVLLCLANGNRRRDVAERLHMSPNTVRTHLQNLMAKLDVHSALEAVALTRRLLDEDLSLRPYGRPHPGPYGRPRPGTPGHMRLRPRPREDQDPAKAKTPPRPRPRQGQDPAKAKTPRGPRPREGQDPRPPNSAEELFLVTRLYTSGQRRWRSPIQLGYAAKPWWKFRRFRRFRRFLMPVFRRFYPVGADVAPPADIDALARWMERWGLLPSRPARAVARRRLEALASCPVETIRPEVMQDRSPGEILRLPAEWEPSEAVVIAWPVLYPGLWDFHRDLVAAIAPAARVDVLIPHAIYAPAVLAYLGEGWRDDRRLRFLVTVSDDIWVRDYGPLTCIGKAARRVMVDAVFDPPEMPFGNDDSFPVRYAAHQGCASRHLALHLEGGNLWSDGQGTIITTEGLYARNFPMPPGDVRQRLLEGLGAETLIVVPPLRMEGTGHIDVFAKLATPDTVLMTEPRSVVNGRRLAAAAEVLRASRSAAGCSYRVVALPSVPAHCNWGVSRIWPSYANALTVNHRVLVPTYGFPERDAAALAVYRRVMPDHEVIGVDARIAANAGGAVHCLTMQIPADPGPGDP